MLAVCSCDANAKRVELGSAVCMCARSRACIHMSAFRIEERRARARQPHQQSSGSSNTQAQHHSESATSHEIQSRVQRSVQYQSNRPTSQSTPHARLWGSRSFEYIARVCGLAVERDHIAKPSARFRVSNLRAPVKHMCVILYVCLRTSRY